MNFAEKSFRNFVQINSVKRGRGSKPHIFGHVDLNDPDGRIELIEQILIIRA